MVWGLVNCHVSKKPRGWPTTTGKVIEAAIADLPPFLCGEGNIVMSYWSERACQGANAMRSRREREVTAIQLVCNRLV